MQCFQYEERVVEDKPRFHMETSVEDDRRGEVIERAEGARESRRIETRHGAVANIGSWRNDRWPTVRL